MKYLRLCSDIHVDFDLQAPPAVWPQSGADVDPIDKCWMPPYMDGDDDTGLVIAGDLSSNHQIIDMKYSNGDCWLQRVARKFKYVVFVLGNHDYYKRNFSDEHKLLKADIIALGLDNVHLLEQDTVTLDQVKFVGGTLWTSFNKHDPRVLAEWKHIMLTDMVNIGCGAKTVQAYYTAELRAPDLRAPQVYERFMNTKSFIMKNLEHAPDQKLVIVTHMAPSELSVNARYKHRPSQLMMNYYFFSNLEREVTASGADFWFHGHMHDPVEYVLGQTRVVCNPRGYPYEGTRSSFDPTWRVEL